MAVIIFSLLVILILPILNTRCSCILGKVDQEQTVSHSQAGLYIDLDQPASCSGLIYQWNLCYYSPNPIFFGASLPIELQVWSFNEDLTEGIKVVGHAIDVSIPENPEKFQCISIEVSLDDFMEVEEGDFLGVWLHENALLPVLKKANDFRHLLASPPETFNGTPTVVRYPQAGEVYVIAEDIAIHLTANVTAENVSSLLDENFDFTRTPEDSMSDKAQMVIIGVTSGIAGLELVALVFILIFCIQRVVRKHQSGHVKDSLPRQLKWTSRNAQASYQEPRPNTSQYYATIDDVYSVHEVTLPTTPIINTSPNPSYNNNIDVRINEAYNSTQTRDSTYEDNEAYNQVSLSQEMDVVYNETGTTDERDSKLSYEYPSQRGVFVFEAGEELEDSEITQADEEETSIALEN